MSGAVGVTVTAPLVTCGDPVRGQVASDAAPSDALYVELRCRVDSAEPVETTLARQPVSTASGGPATFDLKVPEQGPITAQGASLAVSWSVVVVDAGGAALVRSPVVVMPRGGMALWLRRHAPPPV